MHSVEHLPSRMACFGASGTGVQVSLDLRYQASGQLSFVGYIDDLPTRVVESGYRVFSLDEFAELDDVGVFVPVHDPHGRRDVYGRLGALGIPILGSRGMPHLSHPDAEIGEGVIITSSTRVGYNTRIGRGSLALSDVVAHDVEVGEFVTLAAHSVILGHVQIDDDAFVGAGAVIRNGTSRRPLVIGKGAIVGAGAVVNHDVAPGQTVISPRALPIAEWEALRRAARRTG